MRRKDSEEAGPSRSAKKREAQAIEEIAQRLADIPEAEWRRIPLSDAVRKEAEQARLIKAHGARKRQVKHLAGVLRRREEEVEELRAFLDGLHEVQLQEKKAFHDLESLRDRLCDPEGFDAAFVEAGEAFPDIDFEAIKRLARSVHSTGDRKASREIFRRLRKESEAG